MGKTHCSRASEFFWKTFSSLTFSEKFHIFGLAIDEKKESVVVLLLTKTFLVENDLFVSLLHSNSSFLCLIQKPQK